ncbi:MAG: hypothetical protein ACKOF9_07235 [Burkholderiales bacterium]
MNNALCLINQSACGRVAGNPLCPKCGMDDRVVYPGQGQFMGPARHEWQRVGMGTRLL